MFASLAKVKHLCDSLAGCDQSVSLEEKQSTIINGLPPEFYHVISIITVNRIPFYLQGILKALLDVEAPE